MAVLNVLCFRILSMQSLIETMTFFPYMVKHNLRVCSFNIQCSTTGILFHPEMTNLFLSDNCMYMIFISFQYFIDRNNYQI